MEPDRCVRCFRIIGKAAHICPERHKVPNEYAVSHRLEGHKDPVDGCPTCNAIKSGLGLEASA